MPDAAQRAAAPEPVQNLYHALKHAADERKAGHIEIEPDDAAVIVGWMTETATHALTPAAVAPRITLAARAQRAAAWAVWALKKGLLVLLVIASAVVFFRGGMAIMDAMYAVPAASAQKGVWCDLDGHILQGPCPIQSHQETAP